MADIWKIVLLQKKTFQRDRESKVMMFIRSLFAVIYTPFVHFFAGKIEKYLNI